MQEQGWRDYGDYAYMPGGSLIDTNYEFHVKTQFLTKDEYNTFWGLRTTLS